MIWWPTHAIALFIQRQFRTDIIIILTNVTSLSLLPLSSSLSSPFVSLIVIIIIVIILSFLLLFINVFVIVIKIFEFTLHDIYLFYR